MKSLMQAAAVLMLLAMVQGCAATGNGNGSAATPMKSEVDQLFAKMEAGQYTEQLAFPPLTRADIPALLQRADSTVDLTTFPTNSLSSQKQIHCSEGMVALWLIEGIRKPAKPDFPSLNALVLPIARVASQDWGAISEQNHAKVAEAYQKWWTDAGSVSEEQGRVTDPLQGTGLYWY